MQKHREHYLPLMSSPAADSEVRKKLSHDWIHEDKHSTLMAGLDLPTTKVSVLLSLRPVCTTRPSAFGAGSLTLCAS